MTFFQENKKVIKLSSIVLGVLLTILFSVLVWRESVANGVEINEKVVEVVTEDTLSPEVKAKLKEEYRLNVVPLLSGMFDDVKVFHWKHNIMVFDEEKGELGLMMIGDFDELEDRHFDMRKVTFKKVNEYDNTTFNALVSKAVYEKVKGEKTFVIENINVNLLGYIEEDYGIIPTKDPVKVSDSTYNEYIVLLASDKNSESIIGEYGFSNFKK